MAVPKLQEYIPGVVFATDSYVVLGYDPKGTVAVQNNKVLLKKYDLALTILAKASGIYLETSSSPKEPVRAFLARYLIKGVTRCWEPHVKPTAMELLLTDLFGNDAATLAKWLGPEKTGKTVVEWLAVNSHKITANSAKVSEKDIDYLVALAKTPRLTALSRVIYSERALKEFHALGSSIAFNSTVGGASNLLYKLQCSGNLTRGKYLNALCKKKGGLFFVSADMLNEEQAKMYGFI